MYIGRSYQCCGGALDTHTGHFYRSEIKVEEDISKATFMLSLRYRERQTNDILWHLRL